MGCHQSSDFEVKAAAIPSRHNAKRALFLDDASMDDSIPKHRGQKTDHTDSNLKGVDLGHPDGPELEPASPSKTLKRTSTPFPVQFERDRNNFMSAQDFFDDCEKCGGPVSDDDPGGVCSKCRGSAS
mmetsp:Transcript_15380/g.26402  ORF Transcript_15380/g.26402 Transcript_15380/m.26402 type:complete len:127 (-) Transcript_15380:27-407(-)